MLTSNSALFSLPANLDKKLLFTLDGMRAAIQIIDFSYKRLCKGLYELTFYKNESIKNDTFTPLLLDAWAFIDAIDRFRCLWIILTRTININEEFSESKVKEKLQLVREIRNVLAHVAQKVDRLASLNSSVSGELSWVVIHNESPLTVKTYFIRSGVFLKKLNFQFALPVGNIHFNEHKIGLIEFKAEENVVDLVSVYSYTNSIVKYLEYFLTDIIQKMNFQDVCSSEVFGSAELDTKSWDR